MFIIIVEFRLTDKLNIIEENHKQLSIWQQCELIGLNMKKLSAIALSQQVAFLLIESINFFY